MQFTRDQVALLRRVIEVNNPATGFPPDIERELEALADILDAQLDAKDEFTRERTYPTDEEVADMYQRETGDPIPF